MIGFSEQVHQKEGQTARLTFQGPYSATTNLTNGFASDNRSASLIHTVGSGSLTDNVSIRIYGVADRGGNTIKERSRDNATFFVDNNPPSNLSVAFLKSDNSSMTCTRSKDVRISIQGADDDFIKAVYVDNSSTRPNSGALPPTSPEATTAADCSSWPGETDPRDPQTSPRVWRLPSFSLRRYSRSGSK